MCFCPINIPVCLKTDRKPDLSRKKTKMKCVGFRNYFVKSRMTLNMVQHKKAELNVNILA